MTKKVFYVGNPNQGPREPVEFELQGRNLKGEIIEPVSFRCLEEVQGTVLTDMIKGLQAGEVFAAIEVTEFIRHCLPEDELKRFNALTGGKETVVQLNVLGDVMMYLVQEYSNRPIEAPSHSPNGPSPTRPISTDASSYSAPTPTPSPPADFSTSSTPPSLMTAAP